MNIRRVIEFSVAGCAVYALVSACGGGSSGGGLLADAASEVFGGGGGWLGDALSDPVPDAKAAPPDVKEAACQGQAGGAFYADVAFPGKTVTELALVGVLVHFPQVPNGYEWVTPNQYSVKDGMVHVYCYTDTTGSPKADGVRVVLPAN